ncbi:MAG: hypothetical protein AVDCRST_MAG05-1266 [uncultured Rubrobacteraceae bacterium]|uniref:Uncharacterized protein n=1 Tax=uncultured Rubrobacteraceae bacterium TaxID=349277 RepID=A0A6J4S1R3_9ACTN|nr:MAG: hypothetical protein AVDCRST_MAG05-1266 [uncultured Rubrobacteraceae bacterium]
MLTLLVFHLNLPCPAKTGPRIPRRMPRPKPLQPGLAPLTR